MKTMKHTIAATLALLLSSVLLAKEPTSAHRKAIQTAEMLGRAMYGQDAAAASATDALMAAVSSENRSGVIGWIVTGSTTTPVVQFIGKQDGLYVTLFDVISRAGEPPKVDHLAPPRELRGDDLGMFLARQAALAAIPDSRCSKNYNTVVLTNPQDDGSTWLVYLLAATTAQKVQIGGHYRATVSKDGAKVLSFEPLSNSCLALSTVGEQGGILKGLGMSHVLNDTPIETHVYLNLLHKIDFYVITEPGMWVITNGSIKYAGPRPGAEKK